MRVLPGIVANAGFIGSLAMNLVGTKLDAGQVGFGSLSLDLDPAVATAAAELDADDLTVGIRPQALTLGTVGIAAEIVVVEELGSETFVFAEMEHRGETVRVRVRVDADVPVARGDNVALSVTGPIHVFRPDDLRLRTPAEKPTSS